MGFLKILGGSESLKMFLVSFILMLFEIPATWYFNYYMGRQGADPGSEIIKPVNIGAPNCQEGVININIRIIIDKIERGTPLWRGIRMPSPEIVQDLEGYYCLLDLRRANYSETLYFRPGEYTINGFDADFARTLNDFNVNILTELRRNNLNYKVFVKGSADITGDLNFGKSQRCDLQFNSVEYYQNSDRYGERYIPRLIVEALPVNYRNCDLPNLRASFLKKKIEENFPEYGPVVILKGLVDRRTGGEYRNASIYLFIDFPRVQLNQILRNKP